MQPPKTTTPTQADHRTADFLAELLKANPKLKMVPFKTVPCSRRHPYLAGAFSILGKQGYGIALTSQVGQRFSITYQTYWLSRP